jgi:hypothetical protein
VFEATSRFTLADPLPWTAPLAVIQEGRPATVHAHPESVWIDAPKLPPALVKERVLFEVTE